MAEGPNREEENNPKMIAAVATGSGHRVLPDAIKASMSIPGIAPDPDH